MDKTIDDKILARASATGPRRVIGVGTLGGLGLLLLWLALTQPPANLLWLVFLIVLGVAALWVAQIMWRATKRELLLTDEALTDSSGAVIARMADVVKVDRGAFALKPSNGFALTLREPGKRAWQPGLWWRTGRRVAVGGVTAARDTKPMADIISVLVMRRDGELPTEE
ncbi:hypothetical protein [Salipiger mangrovisoli]|uniref:Uncharacterized protein n=1 Tax=Salipiger mangrovisoli TaxID=2865933 RepID=A0ABR9X7C1_9RHOB|nr:hypothetical protein [Salipiger mangrovisoli]MBE9639493.1 hypothetical protein [Salipiger mangrovisoli]